jgi:uncharacterized protein YhaN
MRISSIGLDGVAGWPQVELAGVTSGLNVVYGPARSGKSTIANLVAHAIFGKPPATLVVTGQRLAPPGDVVVEAGDGRYRVRRYHEVGGPIRLTVAALDGSAADPTTIHKLVRGLSPTLLSPLCSVNFRDVPELRRLLSAEYARGWQAAFGDTKPASDGRTAELVARRDVLAHELETRIAGERRVSKELEARSREIERTLRDAQHQATELERRLNAVEASLAETDTRLRYRRLELNTELRWQPVELTEPLSDLQELDDQIAQWRQVIGDLAKRESDVRARLGEIQDVRVSPAAAAAEQRAWLGMARQLASDLTGEVARLARASGSAECVCRDAHPRLRPIAETIERQLSSLGAIIDAQHCSLEAAELAAEVDHLAGSQEELRRHVDHLLDRRQAIGHGATALGEDGDGLHTSFSAADAAQLERRRTELEQERFEIVERLRSQTGLVQDLTAQRSALERQRAALLSARSIEHVQRELAVVQQKLEQAAIGGDVTSVSVMFDDTLCLAAEFLAKLTNGDLTRLARTDDVDRVVAVNRSGDAIDFESLPETNRDQVCLSLCLAQLAAASRQGLWLPLILDEPFEHLDERATAALAAVLDDFCRQGHQVLVFTCQRAATERLASLGAAAHDILSLRGQPPQFRGSANSPSMSTKRRPAKRRKSTDRSTKVRPSRPKNGETSLDDKSDAA